MSEASGQVTSSIHISARVSIVCVSVCVSSIYIYIYVDYAAFLTFINEIKYFSEFVLGSAHLCHEIWHVSPVTGTIYWDDLLFCGPVKILLE